MAHDVFLSHSSKDKAAADAACNVLERNGIRVWMAPRDIMPGVGWAKSIIGGIVGAKVMVLMFSSHANTSPQIEREVERAINKSIPIVPFRVEDVQPNEALEYFISSPHWLDAFTPPIEQHFERLVLAVKHLLASGYVKARADEPPRPDGTANESANETTVFAEETPQRSEASDNARRAIQEESVLVAQAAVLQTRPLAEASQPNGGNAPPTDRQIETILEFHSENQSIELNLNGNYDDKSENNEIKSEDTFVDIIFSERSLLYVFSLVFLFLLIGGIATYLINNYGGDVDVVPVISQQRPSPEEVVRDLVVMEACTMAWNRQIQDLIDEGRGQMSSTMINAPQATPLEVGGTNGNKYMYTANNRLSVCGWYFISRGLNGNNSLADLAAQAQLAIITNTMDKIDIAAQDLYAAAQMYSAKSSASGVAAAQDGSLRADFQKHFSDALQYYKSASERILKPIENFEGGEKIIDNSTPITYPPQADILARQGTAFAIQTSKDLKIFDQFLTRANAS